MKALLREYVQLRLDLSAAPSSPASIEQAIRSSNSLQASLWGHAVAVSAADSRAIPPQLFVEALNRMIDLQETRLAARDRVPPIVFVLLYGIAVVVIGFSGYVSGAGERQGRIPVAIMAVLIASVIGMIEDIDLSQGGFVTVSQQAMQDVQKRMDW